MSRFEKLAINCLTAVLAAAVLPSASAYDKDDHRTVIDVPYTVQVDTTTLQPGRYVIRLVDPADATIVRIYRADEKTIVATIHCAPVFRSNVINDKTEFWFDPTPKGQPRVVRAWFYPGEEMGVEILPVSQAKRAK